MDIELLVSSYGEQHRPFFDALSHVYGFSSNEDGELCHYDRPICLERILPEFEKSSDCFAQFIRWYVDGDNCGEAFCMRIKHRQCIEGVAKVMRQRQPVEPASVYRGVWLPSSIATHDSWDWGTNRDVAFSESLEIASSFALPDSPLGEKVARHHSGYVGRVVKWMLDPSSVLWHYTWETVCDEDGNESVIDPEGYYGVIGLEKEVLAIRPNQACPLTFIQPVQVSDEVKSTWYGL